MARVLELHVEHQFFSLNIQDWFPLGLTGLISLQSKGLSIVFSNTKWKYRVTVITPASSETMNVSVPGESWTTHGWTVQGHLDEDYFLKSKLVLHLQNLLELTPPKDVLFITGDWNAKVGSQEISGVTGKFGQGVQNEAGERLVEFCQENALVITNTLFQQHRWRLYMDITRWSVPKSDCLYSLQPKMEKLYIANKNKTGNWLWLRS